MVTCCLAVGNKDDCPQKKVVLTDDAQKFANERFKVRADYGTLERIALAIYDWKAIKIKTENETFFNFEKSLATSTAGSTSKR